MVDITDRYATDKYMEGGPSRFTVDRSRTPLRGVTLHHSAGFYLGDTLTIDSTRDDEVAQLDALAVDHYNRFGLGPGYALACFPSGRYYWLRKYGHSGASVAGIEPISGDRWNNVTLGFVAMGNYLRDPLPRPLRWGLYRALQEIKSWTPLEFVPVWPHRECYTPESSTRYPGGMQMTTCPGPSLTSWAYAMEAMQP